MMEPEKRIETNILKIANNISNDEKLLNKLFSKFFKRLLTKEECTEYLGFSNVKAFDRFRKEYNIPNFSLDNKNYRGDKHFLDKLLDQNIDFSRFEN